LPVFTALVNLLSDLAHICDEVYSALKPIIDLANSLNPVMMYQKLKDVWAALFPDKAKSGEVDATKDHTDAMREHAAALKAGTFGGGPRAKGAMPSAWGGMNYQNWANGQTNLLGAFNL
jgi:hypothetical protein